MGVGRGVGRIRLCVGVCVGVSAGVVAAGADVVGSAVLARVVALAGMSDALSCALAEQPASTAQSSRIGIGRRMGAKRATVHQMVHAPTPATRR